MRSLLVFGILAMFAPLAPQNSSSTSNGSKSADAQAAAVDRALRNNPDTIKSLTSKLSKNQEFVDSLLGELKKNKNYYVFFGDSYDGGKSFAGGGGDMHIAFCDATNDDLREVISELSTPDYVDQVLAHEKFAQMNGKQVHDFRMARIKELTTGLRATAAAR